MNDEIFNEILCKYDEIYDMITIGNKRLTKEEIISLNNNIRKTVTEVSNIVYDKNN